MLQRSFISALFYVVRPSACLGLSLFAVAGLGRWDDIGVALLTFVAAFIGTCGCFLINDIFDREKDLKNNKLRPIATGEISVRTAGIITAICFTAMFLLSTLLGAGPAILSVFLIAGFGLYSYINRTYGLLANIWVSVCSTLEFLYGALVYELTLIVIAAMFFTFFVTIAREILLDALDQKGDQAVGKPSIPLMYGERRTKLIVFLLYALGTAGPVAYLFYSPIIWPVIGVLILLLWVPFFMKTKEGFRQWALFNVRASHFYFAVLIVLVFINSIMFQKHKQAIALANFKGVVKAAIKK